MSEYVVCGDVHGHLDQLHDLIRKLTERMDLSACPLVFLGDYVDGGPSSRQLLDYLRALHEKYPHWIFLKGNHDLMFCNAAKHPEDAGYFYHWFRQGGCATARSYDPSIRTDPRATHMLPAEFWEREDVKQDIAWLDALPLVHETEKFIFVHAGLKPGETVETTSEEDKLWIREEFISGEYHFGKTVVFGHTYTPEVVVNWLPEHKTPQWISMDTMNRSYGFLSAALLSEGKEGSPILDIVRSQEIPNPAIREALLLYGHNKTA